MEPWRGLPLDFPDSACENRRMTRRRRFLFLPLAAIAVGLVVALVLWSRTMITRENAAKVENGMTRKQVEAILGTPRNETSGQVEYDGADMDELDQLSALWERARQVQLAWPLRGNLDGGGVVTIAIWESDQVHVVAVFDPAGTVAGHAAVPMRRVQESPLAMIRRWLRL